MKHTQHHIHIVGCSPRSGTTLTSELFRTSFNIDGHYDYEKSVFKADYQKGNILLTKAPNETIYFPWLLHINPRLYCIYISRDPRDAISSRHKKAPEICLSNLRLWRSMYQAAENAEHHPRFINIRYEDLVNDPDRLQIEIANKLPFLEITRKFSQFGENTKVSTMAGQSLNQARPISSSSVGRWKSHLGRIKQQINLHGDISKELIELGYEQSSDWMRLLDDINPDTTPSGEPDFLPWHKHLRVKYRVFRKIIWYTYMCYLGRLRR